MNRRGFVETSLLGAGGIIIPPLHMKVKRFQPLRFGIVTDIHFADAPANTQLNRYYRQSTGKLEEFIQVMNKEKVDFIIEIGDLKDQRTPPLERETLQDLQTIESLFAKFTGPRYHVLGNHDHDSISKSQFLKSVQNSGFAEAKNYYSFTKKGIHFIVLDANYESDEKEYDHGKFDWTNALVPSRQMEWLKKELKTYKEPSFIFVHHQLDSSKVDDIRHCPVNADEIRKVLEDSGKVPVVFQGHFHKGSLNYINGICYYTLKSLVEGSGPENNNYAIVRIEENGEINLEGFRQTISQHLSNIK